MPQSSFAQTGAAALVFTVNPRYPGRVTVEPGCVTGLTEGGSEYVYDKRGPYATLSLRFEGMPASEFDGGFDYATSSQAPGTQSLVNWFLNVFGAGREPFTYRDPFGKDHLVTISDARLDFSLTDYGLYDGTITLRKSIGR